jgi:hypothetical protein
MVLKNLLKSADWIPLARIWVVFMSMGCGQVSELCPPTGLLFKPRMIYGHRESWWNYIHVKAEELGEILSQCHSVHNKSHMD